MFAGFTHRHFRILRILTFKQQKLWNIQLLNYSFTLIYISFVFQHLFMTFPRIVFMLVSFALLIPMVGTFALYHVFLISANQTTNERYKRVSNTDYNPVESVILNNRTKSRKITKTRADEKTRRTAITYDRGLLINLYEVFFTKTFLSNNRKHK